MNKEKTLWGALAVLFFFIILGTGGYAIYRISWMQGFQAGLTSTGAESLPALTLSGDSLGTLIIIAIILVVMMAARGFLRSLLWMTAMPGMMSRHWTKHHMFHHPGRSSPITGSCPWWAPQQEQEADKTAADA